MGVSTCELYGYNRRDRLHPYGGYKAIITGGIHDGTRRILSICLHGVYLSVFLPCWRMNVFLGYSFHSSTLQSCSPRDGGFRLETAEFCGLGRGLGTCGLGLSLGHGHTLTQSRRIGLGCFHSRPRPWNAPINAPAPPTFDRHEQKNNWQMQERERHSKQPDIQGRGLSHARLSMQLLRNIHC